jgi:hypothetical protein
MHHSVSASLMSGLRDSIHRQRWNSESLTPSQEGDCCMAGMLHKTT